MMMIQLQFVAGLLAFIGEITYMDKIQESAMNFLHLVDTTRYIFHVARRNVKIITLDFSAKDFHHIAGLPDFSALKCAVSILMRAAHSLAYSLEMMRSTSSSLIVNRTPLPDILFA